MGFIPISHYDNKLANNLDYWLTLWKADENAPSGTGFALLRQLEKCFTPRSIVIVGNNSTVRKLYQALGYTTGVLNHYYIPNPNITALQIGENLSSYNLERSSIRSHKTKIKEISLQDIVNLNTDYYPQKSKAYIENRYVKHPYYQYTLYGAYNHDLLVAVIVVRTIKVNNSCCMRIVDIIGETKKIHYVGSDFIDIMKTNHAEYIDCLNHGISAEIFEQWGFLQKNGNTIIPNYFEPFERQNVDIQFAYKAPISEYTIFKGDGDQDRPNIL